jgi:hypothetical protein
MEMNKSNHTVNNHPPANAPLVGWIWEISSDISFDSVYCPFSGNAVIARLFKEQGKEVTTTDVLSTWTLTARALIENDSAIIDPYEAESIIGPSTDISQIHEGTASAYGLPHEFGAWLDKCRANLEKIDYDYKKALAATVISRVIFYMFSLDEESKKRVAEEDWISAFQYYVMATNESVFATENACLSYEKDANLFTGEIFTDAMCFHLPSPRGVANVAPAERYAELFIRNCHEKELNGILAGLVKEGLGAATQDEKTYAANLRGFLDSASHIKHWLISSNGDSALGFDALHDLIASFRPHVTALTRKTIYSKSFSRNEYIFIAPD